MHTGPPPGQIDPRGDGPTTGPDGTAVPLPDLDEAERFVVLWCEATGMTHLTLVAITPDGGHTTTVTFLPGASALRHWIAERMDEGAGVYFQVNETRPGCPKKPKKEEMVAAVCRHSDADPDDVRHPLPEERVRLGRLADALDADPELPPTVVIDSGNGVQPVWAVEREPLDGSPASWARMEAESEAAGDAIGAPRGTANIDRLLRLPGTLNFPNRRKRDKGRGVARARLLHADPTRRYTAAQAARLGAHLAARFDGSDLVRRHGHAGADGDGRRERGNGHADSHPGAGQRTGGDGRDGADPDLLARIYAAVGRDSLLARRWAGDTSGLKDTSRSGLAFALGGLLKRAGFSYSDMCAALRLNEHTRDWAGEQDGEAGERQMRRIWERAGAREDGHADAGAAEGERARRGKAENAGYDPWPAPLDFIVDDEIAGVPELRRDHLPDAVAPFAFDTATRMGVDPASVALSCIVSLSSVINDDWHIQPKQHDTDWTEQARVWGGIIGPPSILKTPVIRAASKPVVRLEVLARKRHADEMRKWKAEVEAMKADKATPPYPAPPRCDRYLVESTTVEALQEILREGEDAKFNAPASKVLARQDELSEWLAGMDQYKAGGKGGADRGSYLRLYNGGRHTVDRVGRGSFTTPNWSACILGGIQPEPIQRIAKDAADDGLLQRFLFIVPTGPGEEVDRAPDAEAAARYAALFPALAVLGPPRFQSGDGRPVVLDAGAHKHRLAINALLKAQEAMPDVSPRMKATLGKWSGTFARLALVYHLADIADANARGEAGPPIGILRTATAERTAALIRDVLLPHLLRAEATLFATAQTGHAYWIANYILASEECRKTLLVKVRDVQRAYHPLRAPENRRELEAVLTQLEVAGWLRAEPRNSPAQPLTTWHVNPALHTAFADRAAKERARRDAAKAGVIRNMQRGRDQT